MLRDYVICFGIEILSFIFLLFEYCRTTEYLLFRLVEIQIHTDFVDENIFCEKLNKISGQNGDCAFKFKLNMNSKCHLLLYGRINTKV